MSRRPFVFERFVEIIEAVETENIERFATIVHPVLAALGSFDALMARGELTSGEYQAKGFFFNEVVARLIERCAGLGVAKRGKRPGILLANVDVDICYPADPGTRPEVIAETKMAGTPKHPGNPRAGALGRRGSADLDKRMREIALNVIDLKLADLEGASSPIGDISTWIQQTRPPFFAFFGIRAINRSDLETAVRRAQLLGNSYANGVGLLLYEPVDIATEGGRVTYRQIPSPGGMSIDDAVIRICRLIKSVGSQHRPAEPAPPGALPDGG